MKKNKYGLTSLSSVMDDVVKKLGLDRRFREITLINMWPEIIGNRFRDKSRALYVKRKDNIDVLVLAVYSSVISQELTLHKNIILNKIAPVAHSLEFNVKDLVFNSSLWKPENKNIVNDLYSDPEIIHINNNPTDEDLESISVPENIIFMIRESINNQTFSSPEFKDRLMNTIIKDVKIQIWKKEKGFPICERCGIPINFYHQKEKKLCPSCKYEK